VKGGHVISPGLNSVSQAPPAFSAAADLHFKPIANPGGCSERLAGQAVSPVAPEFCDVERHIGVMPEGAVV
jgi:hypothetical protein